MSSIKLSPNALGTGSLTIAAPNTNSALTLNLPDTLGTNNGSALVSTDASGNMGLGVAPSAWGTWKALDINTNGSIASASSSLTVGTSNYWNGTNWIYKSTGVNANRIGIGNGDGSFQFFTAPSGTAGAAISFTQAMTLDAFGDLYLGRNNVDGPLFATTNAVPLRFGTGGSERARIDSSGRVALGSTVAATSTLLTVSTNSRAAYFLSSSTTPTQDIFNIAGSGGASSYNGVRFWYGALDSGSVVGSISFTSTATAYNTSSDYRLKENIQPMTGALAKIQALKPVTYTWKADGSAGEGFIAHELAEVCPAAVTGEKDAVDAEGNPQYQGIDVSFLVGTLTAAIQEQQALITSLTARITALESK